MAQPHEVAEFAETPDDGQPANPVVNVTNVSPFVDVDFNKVYVKFWQLAALIALASLGAGETVALVIFR